MWDSVQHVGAGSSGSNGPLASHGGHARSRTKYRAISLCERMPLAEENFSCTMAPCRRSKASAISSAKGCVVLCQACKVKGRMRSSDDRGRTFVHMEDVDKLLRAGKSADRCRICTAAQERTRTYAGRFMKESGRQALGASHL
jgi:hypothetical protein